MKKLLKKINCDLNKPLTITLIDRATGTEVHEFKLITGWNFLGLITPSYIVFLIWIFL